MRRFVSLLALIFALNASGVMPVLAGVCDPCCVGEAGAPEDHEDEPDCPPTCALCSSAPRCTEAPVASPAMVPPTPIPSPAPIAHLQVPRAGSPSDIFHPPKL